MGRYFKFKHEDEIRATCKQLGTTIEFQKDLRPLFERMRIGSYRVGNRLCIQPMEGCDGKLDGAPDVLTFRRYQRFGAGGAKLIWFEATAVVPEGRANPRQLLLNEDNAPAFEKLVHTCRRAHRDTFGSDDDLIVGLQLTHSGRYSYPIALLAYHDPLLDPLTIADQHTRRPVDIHTPLVTDEYLYSLVDQYIAAAKWAWKIGFQFVDIKQCHRYLLSELLSARARRGPFGGDLENRTRLARMIITGIRSEVPELMLASRINVYDGVPYRACDAGSAKEKTGSPVPHVIPVTSAFGTDEREPAKPDLAEPLQWISQMISLGVALINVTMGNPYVSPHLVRPFDYPPPDGYAPPEHPLLGVDRHMRLTEAVQRAFPHVAVVGSGYSYLQDYLFAAAAFNIATGRVSLVGVGRGALPQPDFVRQLLDKGCLDRKRICRTFSYCTALMRSKHNNLGQFPTGCPPFDKEVYGPIWAEACKGTHDETGNGGRKTV